MHPECDASLDNQCASQARSVVNDSTGPIHFGICAFRANSSFRKARDVVLQNRTFQHHQVALLVVCPPAEYVALLLLRIELLIETSLPV